MKHLVTCPGALPVLIMTFGIVVYVVWLMLRTDDYVYQSIPSASGKHKNQGQGAGQDINLDLLFALIFILSFLLIKTGICLS